MNIMCAYTGHLTGNDLAAVPLLWSPFFDAAFSISWMSSNALNSHFRISNKLRNWLTFYQVMTCFLLFYLLMFKFSYFSTFRDILYTQRKPWVRRERIWSPIFKQKFVLKIFEKWSSRKYLRQYDGCHSPWLVIEPITGPGPGYIHPGGGVEPTALMAKFSKAAFLEETYGPVTFSNSLT